MSDHSAQIQRIIDESTIPNDVKEVLIRMYSAPTTVGGRGVEWFEVSTADLDRIMRYITLEKV